MVSRLIHLFPQELRLHTPGDAYGPEVTPQQIGVALRAGRCPPDPTFDAFMPVEYRVVSRQFWTPLVVVLRAARWLEAQGVRSAIDIGSGAGKFCVAAALVSSCRFTGIEQRPSLVSTARRLAKDFEVDDRVSFVEGVFGDVELPEAELYYMYNPFGENIFDEEHRLDDLVELSDARYDRDRSAATRLLEHAQLGTYVLTYNGFGGSIPDGYAVVRTDRELPNVLCLWKKVRESGA